MRVHADLARDTVIDGISSAFGELTPKRDRLFLAGVAAAASFLTSADFDAERDLRLLVGIAWEPRSTFTGVGAGVGVTDGAATARGLRPSARLLASSERRSE
jgi:hypothetical protein